MGDLPGLVRLSIALRIQPNDGPVFFKVDGQRFGQNRTIKLLTGSSYKVEVKIKPTTLQVENISIGGVLVPLELKGKEPDGERVVYTGIYDTEGVAPTKSGERQPIQITMPGSVFNTWKPMWVVLLEDGIEFYKKKSDNSPKGMIPLKGSTLTSPCQDFGKRMFVLKITTTKQQDHFFQAAFLEERDAWVRDIKKAIKCIEGGQKFARKSTRRSIRLPETIDLGALYLSMKDPEKGIKELNLEKDKKVFNHCLTGSGVIDWLVSNKLVRNRQEGLMISASLLSEGYLQPAGDLSKNAADGIAENPFLDSPDAFYYFPDSGFFCEENSSDDDVILREEFRGVIIKQGCLLKQGHRRKNWKVRKFILREDPAYLHYYDPAGGEDPLGAVHLRGCVVTSVESSHDVKKSDEENLFEIITADEVHYYLQAATSKERTEWIKAIQVASRTGK